MLLFILKQYRLANIKKSPQHNDFLANLCNDDFTVDVDSNTSVDFGRSDKRIKESESKESLNDRNQKRPCLDYNNQRASNISYSEHESDSQENMEVNMEQDDELKSLRKKVFDIVNDRLEIDNDFIKELSEQQDNPSLKFDNEIYQILCEKMTIFERNKRVEVKDEPIDN